MKHYTSSRTFFIFSFILAAFAFARADEYQRVSVSYSLEGVSFEGTLVFDEEAVHEAAKEGSLLPGLFMVPNWMGPGEAANTKAEGIADDEYVIFVADVYGVDTRPTNQEEASAAAGKLRSGDRQLLRDRASAALVAFRNSLKAENLPVDPAEVVAIGFCFGGGTVLEMARAGENLPGVVSFHGNLDTPQPAVKGEMLAKVLILHGADDPYVSKESVESVQEEMRSAEVDWQLYSYGGAVHSFTNPQANSEGSKYHPVVAMRSFEALEDFVEELFGEYDD